MGTRLKILLTVLCIMGFYAFYYFALPVVICAEKITPFICNKIQKELGYKINIEHPSFKMALSPSIWLKADKFQLLNYDNSVAMSVEKPILKLSLLPVAIGRANIKYFSANNIFIDLYCDKNLKVKLGQYILIKASDFIVDISGGQVDVDKFSINLTDNLKEQKTIIDGKYFNIDSYIKNKQLKTSMYADIRTWDNISAINIDIDTKLPFKKHLDDYPPEISASATNLKLSDFSNYINYFTNGNISDISGILNLEIHSDKKILNQKQYISELLLEKIHIKSKYFEKDYDYQNKIQIKSLMLLEGDTLNIPSVSLITSNLKAKLSGKIEKISQVRPKPALNFKMLDVRAEDILEMLPYCRKFDEMLNIYVSVIKEAHFHSDLDVDIDITDNLQEPLIYGDIKLENAYVERIIKNAPKGASIALNYVGKKLNLDVHVPTNINEFVDVKGDIAAYGNHYADLHITSTPKIDLSEAERVLMPVHKAFDFLLGPVPIMGFSGFGSIDLVVKGTKKDPHTFGWFKTTGANAYFDDIYDLTLNNADSILTFDDTNTIFKLQSGYVNGKKIFIDGTCTLKGKLKFIAKLPEQNIGVLLNVLKKSPMLKDMQGTINMIESADGLSDFTLNLDGQLLDISELKIGKNVHAKGDISFKNTKVKIKNLKNELQNIYGSINFNDFYYKINLTSVIGNEKIHVEGDIDNDNASVAFSSGKILIYDLLKLINIPELNINSNDKNSSFINFKGKYKGSISKIDYKNIKADGNILFNNLNLIYTPKKMPIVIHNGNANIKNGNMSLNRLNMHIGTMPVVIGGNINNLFEKTYTDLSIFARPNQKAADYLYNSSAVYPIKLKGDIALSASLSGYLNKLETAASLKINKNSSLYYMGATLGNTDFPINLIFNGLIEPDRLNIKSFKYNKFLTGSSSPIKQLTASGQLSYTNNDINFRNFKIQTQLPTDMRIFNVIFKKPLIKEGNFTSDIVVNGSMAKPVIRGDLDLINMDIPFVDASIRNISLKFNQNHIFANITGHILSNNFQFDADALNKLSPPYIINSAKLNAGNLNIDHAYEAINNFEIESNMKAATQKLNTFDLRQLIIKKLEIVADEVIVNSTNAKNLNASISLKNHLLSVDKFNFNLAQGKMDGSVVYDIPGQKLTLDLNVNDADSDKLATSLLGLKGQIFGNLGGRIELSCEGTSQPDCLSTLSGRLVFQVKDGKMPKLGSLEYLLKAGNLVKGGITGLTLNGIMDLVVPLNTGDFDIIKGSIDINNGVADKIQILTEGKDLNLYIIGECNLVNSFADMYVFGRLSKKISTILGPVGNLSLNTLFNTIPGINLNSTSDTVILNSINKIPGVELSNKLFRVFAAEIHGDISGDDYVESFKWIE